MVTLRKRGEVYYACFRVNGKQIHRTLNTTDDGEADYILCDIRRVLHRLETGQQDLPPD